MSAEVQLQMRRNVEQAHDAVEGLGDWLNEVGKKDANLRGVVAPTGAGHGGDGDETDEEEEAREIEAAKAELRRLAAAQEAEQQQQGKEDQAVPTVGHKDKVTHAQRYGKWDRFDADGIVKGIEEREADQERLRKEVVRLENARAQAKARKATAAANAASEALKLQGNEAFGQARYEEAVSFYTDALSHTPRSAILYANRALALLKLSAHAEAEEDCDASLMIDGGFVKALLRRAQARHAMEKYDLALEDLEAALEREPKNGAARSLMAECRRLKAAAAPKPKPKMMRVKIEARAHDPDNDGDPFVEAMAPAKAPAPPAAAVSGGDAAADPAAAASDASGGSSSSTPLTAEANAERVGKAVRSMASAKPTADSFGTPGTLAEMERAWRSLRSAPAEFAALIQRIDPAKLQALFKSNLPAEIFSAILSALDTAFFPDQAARAVEILRGLTSAGRFSILTMCLDKADTKAIGSIFSKLEKAEQDGSLPADAGVAALKKQYA